MVDRCEVCWQLDGEEDVRGREFFGGGLGCATALLEVEAVDRVVDHAL